MAVTLPTSAPPVDAAERVVPFLLAQLPDTPSINSIPILGPLVHLQALSSKSTPTAPTLPLEHVLSIASSNPSAITTALVLDTVVTYAPYRGALTELLSALLPTHTEGLKECLTELTAHLSADDGSDLPHTARAVRTLLCLARAHDEVLALYMEEAATLLPSLAAAYGRLPQSFEAAVVRIKNDALAVVRGLLSRVEGGTRDALLDLLGPPDRAVDEAAEGRVLRSNGLRGDYEALLVRGEMKEGVRKMLEEIREDVPEDPRLAAVIGLFPALPKHLVVQALNHPLFAASGSKQSPDEAAAPLVDAILMGGTDLPPELDELRAAILDSGAAEAGGPGHATTVPRPRTDRRNIFDTADLDISKLKIKAEEAPLPSIGRAIPDHLRESILRLVQGQEDEEEARKRAIAEYEGRPVEVDDMDMDDFAPLVRPGSGGDTSDQDDSSGSHKITRKPRSAPETFYNQQQLMALEMAYLTNPAVYDRNAATRRGDARAALRKDTGLDDTQLEGWRIMFDRNPHKDAILARYSNVPTGSHPSLLAPPATGETASSASSRGRGRGGWRGGGGGRSRGSHGGSTGGHTADVSERGGGSAQDGSSATGYRGGRGGGRGRGEGGPRREHKGSRGHQNAARTRGHDRKMGRMGLGGE